MGLRADFFAALRALSSGQAGLTIVLASLAPFTLLIYASSDSYAFAQLFNATITKELSASWSYGTWPFRSEALRLLGTGKFLIGILSLFGFKDRRALE